MRAEMTSFSENWVCGFQEWVHTGEFVPTGLCEFTNPHFIVSLYKNDAWKISNKNLIVLTKSKLCLPDPLMALFLLECGAWSKWFNMLIYATIPENTKCTEKYVKMGAVSSPPFLRGV